MRPVPLRAALRLLARALPPDDAGRSILGDLLEDHARRSPGWRRDVWLAAAAVHLTAVYLPARLAGLRPWRGLVDDVRGAIHGLRRDRGTVALAIVTLGIGLGATTALLSVVYGSLLKPLPFRDADRLVVVADRSVEMPRHHTAGNIALANLRDLASGSRTLSSLAAWRDVAVTLSGAIAARRVGAQEVEAGFFETLGVPMVIGRAIGPFDLQAGAPPVIVLDEALWRTVLGGDPGVLGTLVDVDGRPTTIVGIAPSLTQLGRPQAWLPLVPSARTLGRTSRQVYGVGRLSDAASLDAAYAELEARFERIRAAHPEIGPRRAVGMMPIEAWLIGSAGRSLVWLIAAAVALVLAVACVNVANVLLVRAERRLPDLRLRIALGATRVRLVREMTAEAVLLAAGGAILGAAIAAWSVDVLVARYGTALPRSWEIGLEPEVLAATAAVALLVVAAIVTLPAARVSALGGGRLAAGDRGYARATRAQRALITGQTAIALLLLGLAGLVVNTVMRLSGEDLGVRPAGVLLFGMSITGRYQEPAAAQAFVESVLDRLRAGPAVRHAAVASRRPLFGGGNGGFVLAGRGAPIEGLEVRDVTPEYFEALGVPHVSGRPLVAADRLSGGVALVNRAFERAHLQGASAIGGRIQPSTGTGAFTIVGVVGDVREVGPTQPARPTAYFPYGRGPYGVPTWLTVIVRADLPDPLALLPGARAALHELDPHIAVEDPVTLADQARSRIGDARLAAQALLSIAASLAVLLTAVGVFGVMSQSVARRTREIGIRRALGATRAGVMRLLIGQGLALALPGLVLGATAFAWGGRLVERYLHGVTPADAVTFAAAAAVMVASLVLACWLPARRAARVEATEALRAS